MARKTSQNLDTYREKRKADRTPEPFGSGLPAARRFVVQHHAARARHYDFRLELGGVLKSWAVPKGPSPNPQDKRLAVHVEDHPVEYVNFEGLIPEGNYGAGAVIVWDRGSWISLNDAEEGLEHGKLLFELRGYKLRGRWTLVKTRRGEKDWLLIKERDQYVLEEGTESYPADSILSGSTVDELARGDERRKGIRAQVGELSAERKSIEAGKLRPMLATVGKIFSDPAWAFELKYDGYRLLAHKDGESLTLYSRAGNDLTGTFPEIAGAVAALPFEGFVIDGEVVVHDERGLPSFSRLQKRGRLQRRADIARAAVEHPATYYSFDLLWFEGYDLRPLKLLDRKDVLHSLLPSVGPLRFSEHILGEGEAMFEQVQGMGLEGIVAKRADSRYLGRRSPDWIKVNAEKSDDFAVLGYSVPKGAQPVFGSLLLGQYRDNEAVYVGRVGTGLTHQQHEALAELLSQAPPGSAPDNAPGEKGLCWVDTPLVVQAKFKERTADGLLRQPAFLRLRDDKTPRECKLPSASRVLDEPTPAKALSAEKPQVNLTNLDKVFWPEQGYTKGDMIRFYRAISPWLLPYLRDRPVVLTRYPDGIDGKSFFQKDAPVYAPEWLRLETMWSEHAEREIRYFVLDDADSLIYVANMASIPLHVWSSRVVSLERPDWCILDLDPKGAPLGDVVKIARYLRGLCDDIGLPSYPKTSGSTGIHVLIPLGARYTYEQSRTLAELLARVTAAALPDIATVTRAVEAREGKVYVDYLQNGHGRLLVAPFSVRPLPEAPVSMPLKWSQVTSRLRLNRFTIRTAPGMLEKSGDPLTQVLTDSADVLGALGRLQQLIGY